MAWWTRPAKLRWAPLFVLLLAILASIAALGKVTPAAARTAADLPEVPVITFGAPQEWQVRPHAITMGDSACAPRFYRLHWLSYGDGGGRAVGRGVFPVLHPYPDDCDRAYYRARPKRVHIVISRPRSCEGHLTFTRIGWRARGDHSHYVTTCD